MSHRNGTKLIELQQMPLEQLWPLIQNRSIWVIEAIFKMRSVTE